MSQRLNSQTFLLQTAMVFRLLLLLAVLGVCVLPLDAQPGFISIDCGSSTNYTDNNTNILWSTDASYVIPGSNGIITSNIQSNVDNAQQLQTLRYFPEKQSRYCYVLYPVIKNSTYLIRATFLYPTSLFGTLSQRYTFKLAVDATIWTTVSVNTELTNTPLYAESVYLSVYDQISVCIIPDGLGTPFISALELRPLSYGMYPEVSRNAILNRVYRLNCGAALGSANVRYPYDIYDRIWLTPTSDFTITYNSTDASIPVDVAVFDNPPQKVLQSAWVGNGFWFNIPYVENTSYFYIALYFNDFLPRSNASDIRGVYVTLNGVYWYNLTLTSSTVELYNTNQFETLGHMNFSLSKPLGANLGPLINGAELYANYKIQSTTFTADVNSLSAIKNVLNLEEWVGDPCNPVPWDWVTCSFSNPPRIVQIKLSNYATGGNIPADILLLDQLTDLWLDGNNLTGSIESDLGNLVNLQTLRLQNNALSGTIPSTLADIPELRELNVANNNLSGTVPAVLVNATRLTFTFTGNPYLCITGNDCMSSPAQSSKKSSSNVAVLVGGIAGGIAVVVIIVIILCFCYFRRKKSNVGTTNEDAVIASASSVNARVQAGSGSSKTRPIASPESHHPKQARSFSLAEVRAATDDFKLKIGQGGFGPVFYGKLPSGDEVAVKVNSDDSSQGATEFFNEVALLSRVHHKNLVSLVGYCEEDNHQILIYDYMPEGTLRSHLYGVEGKQPLDWKTRLDIALNSARGIEYLHNDCSPRIIHRDVKSNNILLNHNLLGKVADFGISKVAPDGDISGVSTVVRGTTGYLDPEYFTANKLTQKSDVYSFGVVLLEIICGRMPHDNRVGSLIEWSRMCLRDGNIDAIVDPILQGTYNVEAMWKIAELAMFSVEPRGVNRPDISQVVRTITEAVELENTHTGGGTTISSGASNEISSEFAPRAPYGRSSDNLPTLRDDRDEPGLR